MGEQERRAQHGRDEKGDDSKAWTHAAIVSQA